MKSYHCFWTEPVGNIQKYEATDSEERLQELVSENEKNKTGDYTNVRNLRVIYGEILEFEPIEVVTRWRIKG